MKINIKKSENVVSGHIDEITEENGQIVVNVFLSEDIAKRLWKGYPLVVSV